MKRLYKFFGLFIIIILIVASIGIFTAGCKKEKKAIIIIPGVTGSALVDSNTGEALWDPMNGAVSVNDLFDENGNISISGPSGQALVNTLIDVVANLNSPDSLIKRLGINEDGSPTDTAVVPADMNTPSDLKYGTVGFYKEMYQELSERYNKDYEVTIFQYDWRLDVAYNVEKLEQFIENIGYDRIIFVSHSMGGVITTNYLLKKENRAKVDMFLSVATPFLGSVKALRLLLDPTEVLDMLPENIRSLLSDKINEILAPLLWNSYVGYQLFPTADYFDTPQYTESSPFYINGSESTYRQMMDYIGALSIVRKSDDSVKPQFSAAEEFHGGQFVTVGGERKHITDLVNTYYFVGVGVDTDMSVKVDGDGIAETVFTKDGDLIVPKYSASCGKSLDDERVFTYLNCNHGDIASKFNQFIGEDVIRLIDSLN